MKRIKNVFSQWKAERQRKRELYALLDNLIDPTFLERATNGIS